MPEKTVLFEAERVKLWEGYRSSGSTLKAALIWTSLRASPYWDQARSGGCEDNGTIPCFSNPLVGVHILSPSEPKLLLGEITHPMNVLRRSRALGRSIAPLKDSPICILGPATHIWRILRRTRAFVPMAPRVFGGLDLNRIRIQDLRVLAPKLSVPNPGSTPGFSRSWKFRITSVARPFILVDSFPKVFESGKGDPSRSQSPQIRAAIRIPAELTLIKSSILPAGMEESVSFSYMNSHPHPQLLILDPIVITRFLTWIGRTWILFFYWRNQSVSRNI